MLDRHGLALKRYSYQRGVRLGSQRQLFTFLVLLLINIRDSILSSALGTEHLKKAVLVLLNKLEISDSATQTCPQSLQWCWCPLLNSACHDSRLANSSAFPLLDIPHHKLRTLLFSTCSTMSGAVTVPACSEECEPSALLFFPPHLLSNPAFSCCLLSTALSDSAVSCLSIPGFHSAFQEAAQ